MSQISPQMVKELRDKTGAGMADCKKALVEAEGDMKAAIEVLRKKGAASASKRADKIANEGIIAARTANDGKKAIIVEINCETDFVARNAEFESYVNNVAEALISNNISNVDELMKVNINNDTIEGIHNEILAKFSENIGIRRFETINSVGYVSEYIHAGSKLGVLVEVSSNNLDTQAQSYIRDIAMQIAAMNPMFIDRSQVDTATLEKEKEIYKQQAIDQGKKEEIAEKIAQGRLEKFYTENCLNEQVFVKDPNLTINDVLNEIKKLNGEEISIKSFIRYALGELQENEN